MRSARSIALIASLAAACGDGSSEPGDARPDAADGAQDAAADTGPRDTGPTCPEPCGPTEPCCPVDDGEVACIDVVEDPDNCGGCGIVCAEGRGTECVDGRCRCGFSTFGCEGNASSTCCPPRRDGGMHYCASFESDGDDCGGCNERCDPAVGDRCAGGRCVCGDGDRTGCEGTMTDHCCPEPFEQASCVDLTSDGRHCGECGRGCLPSDECCGGVCCKFGACDDGVCTDPAEPADAGMPDAGGADGGADAGRADAGTDAGAVDAAADGSG